VISEPRESRAFARITRTVRERASSVGEPTSFFVDTLTLTMQCR
jgi:hypothetical protein